ncbi:hypothetical protein GQ607_000602 [Colletotrichum asianum]|uniref:Uncharacterized protein n=1 Tax=Colletotrichum asianum TaxID=702518 RepID=A0A8H3WUI5_9PEZI|nr:hypothetical protein GQ607_000602 [Colletotrichum asianum]
MWDKAKDCAEGESNPRLPDAAGWQRRILPLNHRR